MKLALCLLVCLVLGDYRKEYAKVASWSSKVTEVAFYSGFTFKTKEISKKLSELPEFEQQLFIMKMLEKLTFRLEHTEETWQEEAKKLVWGKVDVFDGDDVEVNKQYSDKFLEKLRIIRKEVARTRTEFMEQFFEDYADKVEEAEKNYYLKQMQAYNKRHKL